MMKLRNSPVLKTSSLLAAAISILAVDTKVGVSAFLPQPIAVNSDSFPPMLPQMVIEQESKANTIHLDSNRALPSYRCDFERKAVFPKSVQALPREGESALQMRKQFGSFGRKALKWIVFGFISIRRKPSDTKKEKETPATAVFTALFTIVVPVFFGAIVGAILTPFDAKKAKTTPAITYTKNLIEEIGSTRLLLIFVATAVKAYFAGGPGVALSKLWRRLLIWVCGLFLAWSETRNTSTPEIRNSNGFQSYDGSFPITAEQS